MSVPELVPDGDDEVARARAKRVACAEDKDVTPELRAAEEAVNTALAALNQQKALHATDLQAGERPDEHALTEAAERVLEVCLDLERIEGPEACDAARRWAQEVLDRKILRRRGLGQKLTDLGNAERFAIEHEDVLQFTPGLGWHYWDRTRWERDIDGHAERCAKATARGIWKRAHELHSDDKKQAYRHAMQSESARGLSAMAKLAQTDESMITPVAEFDTDPFKLTVINGTVDLRSGELGRHRREDKITRLAPVTFDPQAGCPLWDRFLSRAFDSDEELIAYVRQLVGYTLTGDTSEQVLILPFGDGANGKSVFVETIAALLGDHAATADAATFTANRNGGIPHDLARLRGARYVRAAETEQGATLARQLVKRVTGGDTIAARFLYGEFFEFTPQFKLWLVTNHLPAIPADDHATWRRIRALPFAVTIPPHEQDRQLPAKLRAELPGILNWALAGCLDWQRHGLGMPEAVRAATAGYRAEQDTVGRFIAEVCETTGTTPAGDLYLDYTMWCEEDDMRPVTQTAFGKALVGHGIHKLPRTASGHQYELKVRGCP